MVWCFQKNELLQSEKGGSPAIVSCFHKKWNRRYTTKWWCDLTWRCPSLLMQALMCDTAGKTTAWGQNKIGFVFPLFSIGILNQTTLMQNVSEIIALTWNLFGCDAQVIASLFKPEKNIISNKRFVSGKSLHFVGILEAWKTSFLSNTNLPQGGTQKISEKAKERKTHYQILRGFQRPTLPLHPQN